MTLQEIKNIVSSYIPSLGGRTTLSGTTWDVTANPQVEKALSANTAITLSNTIAGKSSGVLFVTGGGYTLTINGASVSLNASGVTAVSVFALLDGSVYVSSDAGTSTSSASALALDSVSSLLGVYSLRKTRTAYAGSAVKVRRASDNTTQDIGFDSSGNLNVSALNTFISGTTGFIDTWYDQSGNSKNATQATTTAQPQILVNSFNGMPSIKFDGVDDVLTVATSTGSFIPLHAAQGSINIVASMGLVADPNALFCLLGNNGASSTKTGFRLSYDDRASVPLNNAYVSQTTGGSGSGLVIAIETTQNVITPQTPVMLTMLTDNANTTPGVRLEQYVNQTMQTQTNPTFNTPNSGSATHDLQLGGSGNNTFFFAGYMAEVVLTGSKFSSSTRTALLNNQSAYYNIL